MPSCGADAGRTLRLPRRKVLGTEMIKPNVVSKLYEALSRERQGQGRTGFEHRSSGIPRQERPRLVPTNKISLSLSARFYCPLMLYIKLLHKERCLSSLSRK